MLVSTCLTTSSSGDSSSSSGGLGQWYESLVWSRAGGHRVHSLGTAGQAFSRPPFLYNHARLLPSHYYLTSQRHTRAWRLDSSHINKTWARAIQQGQVEARLWMKAGGRAPWVRRSVRSGAGWCRVVHSGRDVSTMSAQVARSDSPSLLCGPDLQHRPRSRGYVQAAGTT